MLRAGTADPARDRRDALRRDPGFADSRLTAGRRGDRPDCGHRRSARAPARGHLDVHARRCPRATSSAFRPAASPWSSSTRLRRSVARPGDRGRDRRPAALGRSAGIRPHAVHGHARPVRAIGCATVIADVLPLDRRVPPEVLGSRRLRRPRERSDPRSRSAAARHRLQRDALQRVGRPRVARRRPHPDDPRPPRAGPPRTERRSIA